MAKLIKVAVRFVIYVVFMFSIIKGMFGGGILGGIGAFIVVAIIASILEARGIMKKLIDMLLTKMGISEKDSITDTIGDTINGTNNRVEKVVECPNCGTQTIIKGATGECEGCGTVLTI